MAIITISRQIGSLGDELATALAEKLGCAIISRSYILENFYGNLSEGTIERLNESAKFFLSPVNNNETATYKDILISKLKSVCSDCGSEKNIIILGLGGCVVFANNPYAINLRVFASEDTRIERTAKRYNIDDEAAQATVAIGDRKHKRFVSIVFEHDLGEPELYDLSLNTDSLSVDECTAAVIAMVNEHKLRLKISDETKNTKIMDHQSEVPVFKNPTEEEFAHILDAYHIEWKYEPKTFPVQWDSEGNVTMAFSPDFYLPRFDLYLELTTMNQKYVTTKNKKLRLVRELYPGTNIKIVYKKDFLGLVERLKPFAAPSENDMG